VHVKLLAHAQLRKQHSPTKLVSSLHSLSVFKYVARGVAGQAKSRARANKGNNQQLQRQKQQKTKTKATRARKQKAIQQQTEALDGKYTELLKKRLDDDLENYLQSDPKTRTQLQKQKLDDDLNQYWAEYPLHRYIVVCWYMYSFTERRVTIYCLETRVASPIAHIAHVYIARYKAYL